MNCICYDNIHLEFKITQKLIWQVFTKYLRKSYHYSATSKISSMGLGSQKGFIANPVHAPPFSNIHSLFFCFKISRVNALGF